MEFLKDMFRQVTGQSVRKGQFSISWRANIQRNELGIDTDMIADVFKTGRKVDSLVKDYGTYSVSISYKWDTYKNEYVITSVRKYEKEVRV